MRHKLEDSQCAISRHDFLTAEECAFYRRKIFDLEEFWENRSAELIPFFTLGIPSYRDAKRDSNLYFEKIKQLNPVLKEHFSPLYDKLLQKLAALLNVRTILAADKGLPGFHIGLSHEEFIYSRFPIHYDVQYLSLPWDYKKVNYLQPVSFTASIALPKEGSGLNYWDIPREDFLKLTPEEGVKYMQTKAQYFMPYEQGKIVLQEGVLIHQVPKANRVEQGDERITLQGHGLYADDVLWVYW